MTMTKPQKWAAWDKRIKDRDEKILQWRKNELFTNLRLDIWKKLGYNGKHY